MCPQDGRKPDLSGVGVVDVVLFADGQERERHDCIVNVAIDDERVVYVPVDMAMFLFCCGGGG